MVTVLGLENDLDSLDLDAGASDSWSITGGSKTTAKSRSRSAADGKAALRKVARLIELFNEVDAAGSGQIRWDAFSEHFTGNSSSSSGGGGGGSVQKDVRYHTDRWHARPEAHSAKSSVRKYEVASLKWAPECSRLLVCVDDRVEVMDVAFSGSGSSGPGMFLRHEVKDRQRKRLHLSSPS
jgi:hypothetical protein